jgi:hypothetical protein
MERTYNCPGKTAIVYGILLLMLFSNVASAAHTFDTSTRVGTTSFPTSPNPRTVSYTAGNGATLMVVSIFVNTGAVTRAGGKPTFNGKTMTAAYNIVPGSANYESYPEIWYLSLTPDDTGSAYTVSVPNTGSAAIQFQVATYRSATGVSALDGNPATNIAPTGANPTASVTTTAKGDVIVSAMGDGNSAAPTAVNVGTAMYRNDAGSYSASTSYYIQASAGGQAITWTVPSDDHVLVVAAFKEVAISTYIPPSPTILSNISGNFWINYTWSAGSGNLTNSYNVSVNGIWTNGSSNTYKNTSLGPHGWSNISVYAFNSSGTGTLRSPPLSRNTQVANNPVMIGNVLSSYTLTAGNTLSIYPTSNDLDGDTPIFTRNFSNGIFYTNNGTLLWTTTGSDTGIYSWQINVTDGFGSVFPANFTVTVTSTSTYSLNTTYTFTENNSNSTWHSISIKDKSSGDALTNVSILNATSGSWESILTTPFTSGASPIEHVNVIKGASGNARSYDAGGGQIKIRYNWTNSLFNNNLGVDILNVTVFYIDSTFLLNITTNMTNIPESNRSELQLKYNVSGDNFTVQIMNTSSGWENVSILNTTGLPYRNITLNPTWLILNGTLSVNMPPLIIYDVFVRYLGINQTINGTLYLDYQRVYSS